MKHTLLFLLILKSVCSFAQPQGINYQGVARDADGNALLNQNISLRLSILDSSSTGTSVYMETQIETTNNSGLFNLSIGTGSIVSGVFAIIPWGQGDKWLKIEMDTAGGTNYQLIGTSQFLSVPYAQYSGKSGNSSNGLYPGTNSGDMLYWNGNSWVKVPVGSNGNSLALCNGIPTWGGCPISITTNSISSVSYFSVNSGGSITNTDGTYILGKGICYSTSPNPTINDAITSEGNGYGNFISSLIGLAPNTTYYLRAYGNHNFGTTYGNEVSFTTLALGTPVVTTTFVSTILATTANCGGNVISDGGATVIARGVCWSTFLNPTITNSITNDSSGTGIFTSNIFNLTPATTYFVRSYATNSQGTTYGNQISFNTTSEWAIGNQYQGGIVAYVLQPGDLGYDANMPHGIILALNLTFSQWYNGSNSTVGATGTAIGTGNSNTNTIIAHQVGVSFNAARFCFDLVLNGYSDWYLPSKDELNMLYLNRASIGYFVSIGHWSSSENGTTTVWGQDFATGVQFIDSKTSNYEVRAVRAF